MLWNLHLLLVSLEFFLFYLSKIYNLKKVFPEKDHDTYKVLATVFSFENNFHFSAWHCADMSQFNYSRVITSALKMDSSKNWGRGKGGWTKRCNVSPLEQWIMLVLVNIYNCVTETSDWSTSGHVTGCCALIGQLCSSADEIWSELLLSQSSIQTQLFSQFTNNAMSGLATFSI